MFDIRRRSVIVLQPLRFIKKIDLPDLKAISRSIAWDTLMWSTEEATKIRT